uniref:DDE-1 domain-containing protein n=1 Tax=Aceria tosichella TaxID=561515 RepID=A0A6G1SAD7_9ACAR
MSPKNNKTTAGPDPALVARVKDQLKRKPTATYKEISQSLRSSPALIKRCFEAGNLKYMGNLRAPRCTYDVMQRRIDAAEGILRRTDPSQDYNKIVVMDKETCIPVDPNDDHFRTGCWLAPGQPVPLEFLIPRMRGPGPEYYMIWQAMGSDGSYSPAFISIGKMKTDIYIKCLSEILLPWIEKQYGKDNVLFWPDLTPCHYTTRVTQFLDKNNIDYVTKSDNAPKLTHARPIETCSEICKQTYSTRIGRNSQPESLEEFKKIWTDINKDVMEKHAKELCSGFRQNLLSVTRMEL